MFEWRVCAASLATQVASHPGMAAIEQAPADVLEFLADWGEDESMARDADAPSAADEDLTAHLGDLVARPSSTGTAAELLR